MKQTQKKIITTFSVFLFSVVVIILFSILPLSVSAVTINLTSGSSWTVPADWNSSDNTIECIGSGGRGSNRNTINANAGGGGGGGGAYARITNLSLTPGASVPYVIGAGGSIVRTSFNTSSLVCDYGISAGTGTVGTGGGLASNSTGAVRFSGGSGSSNVTSSGGGGGGAGGPNANGTNGSGVTGGVGGGGSAGWGGGGGSLQNIGGAGGNYGGGGGGGGGGLLAASEPGGPGGAGRSGIIIITYTPTAVNNPPSAYAGIDRVITQPENSSSAGGATADDPGGSVASTIWSFISGPATPTITNGSTLTPTFNGMSNAGVYTFRLRVTDNLGLFTDDTMTVTVNVANPQCADGFDNDGDGVWDQGDWGCYPDYNRTIPSNYTASDNTESNPTCSAGWGPEMLVYDGWAGSGQSWCANTSYGACPSNAGSGGTNPSNKGSVNSCCRGGTGGEDDLGWGRVCQGSSPIPVNAICGTSAGSIVSSEPTGTAACAAGTYTNSPADTSTNWNWTCTGLNGGANASCSATRTNSCTWTREWYSELAGDPPWQFCTSVEKATLPSCLSLGFSGPGPATGTACDGSVPKCCGGSPVGENGATCNCSAPISFTLTTTVSPVGGGSVSNNLVTYTAGTTAGPILATANTGYTFSSWSGACVDVTVSSCSILMDGNKSATANFVATTYTLSVNSSGASSVAITSTSGDSGTTNYTRPSLASGSSRVLTAPATSGAYTFSSWTGCSSVTGTYTCNRTMDADRTVTANYVPTTYTLTVAISPGGGGDISGPGIDCPSINCTATYPVGTLVPLMASPRTGYNFVNWTGACSTTATACNVSMDSDKSATANFVLAPSFDYSLGPNTLVSTTQGVSVNKSVTKTLLSGSTEPVSLVVISALPSGVSMGGISNQLCNPTCSSNITFIVSPTAAVGTHSITVEGQPLNKQLTFNLQINPSPAVSVTCGGSPNPALIGESVTWSAVASGGTPPYVSYTWAGTDIPTSPAPTGSTYVKSYNTIGLKNANVTVEDSIGVTGGCTPGPAEVRINFNPAFEEF